MGKQALNKEAKSRVIPLAVEETIGLRPETIKFFEEVLDRYDKSRLEWIVVRLAKGSHGLCRYPVKGKRPGFRITCWVPPVLDRVMTIGVSSWKKEPAAPRVWIYSNDKMKIARQVRGRQDKWLLQGELRETVLRANGNVEARYEMWVVKPKDMEIEKFGDLDDMAVWLFGHEIYHWLRKDRQVAGRNTQNQADMFGLKLLREFKGRRKHEA